MGVFSESLTSAVGMGLGAAPNRASAQLIASACSIPTTAEFWMLFRDLEMAWVTHMNEKKPGEE